jgi:hypothetical protein
VDFPVEEVVHLHEVEARQPPEVARFLHLPPAREAADRPPFVAENSAGGREIRALLSPMVSSDAPYMGEESTSAAISKNAASTSPRARRSGPPPTSNVIQVPRPMAGKRSPLAGTGRSSGAARRSNGAGEAGHGDRAKGRPTIH